MRESGDDATRDRQIVDASGYRAEEQLKDGTPVVLRAVRGDDKPGIRRAFHELEQGSVYSRFFGTKDDVSDEELAAGVDVDFVRNVTLVVTPTDGDIIIGAGRYIGIGDSPIAEVAFTVEEDYHGQGIASLLLRHLIGIARSQGFHRFCAEVLATYTCMLRVFESSGLPMTREREDDLVRVTLRLTG